MGERGRNKKKKKKNGARQKTLEKYTRTCVGDPKKKAVWDIGKAGPSGGTLKTRGDGEMALSNNLLRGEVRNHFGFQKREKKKGKRLGGPKKRLRTVHPTVDGGGGGSKKKGQIGTTNLGRPPIRGARAQKKSGRRATPNRLSLG